MLLGFGCCCCLRTTLDMIFSLGMNSLLTEERGVASRDEFALDEELFVVLSWTGAGSSVEPADDEMDELVDEDDNKLTMSGDSIRLLVEYNKYSSDLTVSMQFC